MTNKLKTLLVLISLLASFFNAYADSVPEPLFGAVRISAAGTPTDSIASSNTSRNLAVSPNGAIYVVYRNSTGILVKKSTDRGNTFSDPIQVYSSNYEAEIAVSSNGYIYVTWIESGNIKFSRSTDSGASFEAPVTVGSGASSVHMAVDGQYVYFVDKSGQTIYVSNDSGSNFTSESLSGGMAYSDVHVDPVTHEIIVVEDNPAVEYYKSTDYGDTFSSAVSVGARVYYSVGSLMGYDNKSYLVTAGGGSFGDKERVRIDLSTGVKEAVSMPDCAADQGRSLSSDTSGNLVTGYSDGTDVFFVVSQNGGDSFSSPVTIPGTTSSNAAINTTNGDVMFLYEVSGVVYLNVYGSLLGGYGLTLSNTNLSYAEQLISTESSAKTVTVSNDSDSAISIADISITGDFTYESTCGDSIAKGSSCILRIKFTPASLGSKSGQLSIQEQGVSQARTILLSGVCAELKVKTLSYTLDSDNDKAEVHGDILEVDISNLPGQHGFVWNKTGSPVISNDKVELGAKSGTGTFNTQITGLSELPYYVRAFYTDANGTYYGNELLMELVDSDGDGEPDSSDNCPSDSNADQVDTDGDGDGDACDSDDDGDNIPDADEGNDDTDEDGIPDSIDDDSDNDGINDSEEGNQDSDGDGTPDFKDEDSDNDGIQDSEEGNGDSDNDGTKDLIDRDSDSDGIPDVVEGNSDSDEDGIPDYLDGDSDNDGIPDSVEAQSTEGFAEPTGTDTDGDGIDDAFDPDNGGTSALEDTDGDGTPDYLDSDSDGDGVSDLVEAHDEDGDGVADTEPSNIDANGDGIDDAFAGRSKPSDFNGDWRSSSSNDDEISLIRKKKKARKQAKIMKNRVHKFAKVAGKCSPGTFGGVTRKASNLYAKFNRRVKNSFPDSCYACVRNDSGSLDKRAIKSQLRAYAKRLFRNAKYIKMQALNRCPPHKKDPNDTRNDTNDDYKAFRKAIKALPDYYCPVG